MARLGHVPSWARARPNVSGTEPVPTHTRPGLRPLAPLLVMLVLTLVSSGSIASASGSRVICRDWKSVRVPVFHTQLLDAVSASSLTDAWAVGENEVGSKPPVVHWDGSSWTAIPQAAPAGSLFSVVAISTNDAWAVGRGAAPLTEHWDGSRWTLVPAPLKGSDFAFYGVSASASNDVWAAGYFTTDVTHPLVEHWAGVAWKPATVPDGPGGNGVFYGVDAISPTDVWAVGYQDLGFADFQPLVEHWDGTAWTVVSTPALGGTNSFLYSGSAVSASDVWIVGSYRPDTLDLPLLFHWDGSSWLQVQAPSGGDQGSILHGVSAVSSGDVWAVGRFFSAQEPAYQPFALHWDGGAWSVRPAAVPAGQDAAFNSVTATTSSDIWGVGSSNRTQSSILIEHSNGPCA